jgi:hypothetical protein
VDYALGIGSGWVIFRECIYCPACQNYCGTKTLNRNSLRKISVADLIGSGVVVWCVASVKCKITVIENSVLYDWLFCGG